MKNSGKLILVILFCSLIDPHLQALKAPVKVITGVFGICDCLSKSTKNKYIELVIKEDSTFTYTDNSDPGNKLNLKGKWVLKNGKIKLMSDSKTRSFHSSWKMDSNTQCIKSRHRLNFRRICLIKPC